MTINSNKPIVLLEGRIIYQVVLHLVECNDIINLNGKIWLLKIRRQLDLYGQSKRPYKYRYIYDGANEALGRVEVL